jgi:preprotein translocase subunit SecG
MLYYVLIALYLIVCTLLLLVVLMQQGRGGDMASAFGGGGGSSQTAFGARAGATVLTRATTILGALFMLGAIILGVYGQRGPGSILSGFKGAAAPASAPAPAPVKK